MSESPLDTTVNPEASVRSGMAYWWLFVPLLFGFAPLMSFYATNAAELQPKDMLAPMAMYLAGVALGTALLFALLRNVARTVFIASILTAAFFYYGHAYSAAEGIGNRVGRLPISPDIILVSFVLVAVVAVTLFVFRASERTLIAAKTLAVIGVSLAATSTASAVVARVQNTHASASSVTEADESFEDEVASTEASAVLSGSSSATDAGVPAANRALPSAMPAKAPDIYYIVLDGYTSNGSLKKVLGYDNSEFTDFLTKRGFYVAPDTKSNYSQTFLCLASVLNMEYLNDDVREEWGADRTRPIEMIRYNRTVKRLKKEGYRYVHVASGWNATNEAPLADQVLGVGISEVGMALNQTTMFRPLADRSMSKRKYEAVREAFDRLGRVKEAKRPKFVFAHVLSPHGPYVFNADGSLATGESTDMTNWRPEQRDNYVAQLRATNRLAEKTVKRILASHKGPLVIVIQGDHGTSFPVGSSPTARYNRRLSVLNAIYFSEGTPDKLYPSISPVNTFRLVLNESIGTDYRLLEDRSYMSSSYRHPYRVKDVTKKVAPKAKPKSEPDSATQSGSEPE